MAKIYGQLERAQLEVLSSTPAAGLVGRFIWQSTLGKMVVDDGTNSYAMLRNDAKLIIGNNGTAANNIRLHRGANAVLQYVPGSDATLEGTLATTVVQTDSRLPNYTTAGLPAPGNVGRQAWDTDLETLVVDTGTDWEPISSGSGEGGINYILNPNIESNLEDIVTTANITETAETGDPIRGTQSLNLTISSAATVADYTDFLMSDIDNIDQDGSKVLTIAFEYETDANFTTGDVEFVLRRNDATAADIPLQDDLVGQILATSSEKVRFTSRVQVDSDANSYSLRMNVLSAPASNSVIKIDSISVGPDALVPGMIAGGFTSYSVNATQNLPNAASTIIDYGAVVTDDEGQVTTGAAWKFTAKRKGTYRIKASIFTNHTTAYDLGEAMSLTLFINGLEKNAIDSIYPQVSGANTAFHLHGVVTVELDEGDFIDTRYSNGSGAAITRGSGVNSNYINIEELARNGAMLSTFEASTTTVKASIHKDQTQIITGGVDAQIDFETVLYDTNSIVSGDTFIIPRTGYYRVSSFLRLTLAPGTGTRFQNVIRAAGTQVAFTETYIASGTGAAESCIPCIKVLKLNRGDVILNEVSSSQTVTIDSTATRVFFEIEELPDFSTFSVFGETEVIEASGGLAAYPVGVAAWGDLTSIPLPVGTFDIFLQLDLFSSGATTTTNIFAGVGDVLGNVQPFGGVNGKDYVGQTKIQTNGSHDELTFFRLNVVVTEPTTYYLKVFAGASVTNLQAAYVISARRVK